MFEKNDTVLYKNYGVCNIDDITEKKFGKEIKKYYILTPLYDDKATLFIPADNNDLMSKMHCIISKDEILDIIKNIPEEDSIWIENEPKRKEKYTDILKTGNRKKIAALIKTLYEKKEEMKEKGKKLHAADEHFFKEAEKILYEEFAHVLDITPEQVTGFIENQISVKES